MEQEEVDVQYQGEIITLRVPRGTSEEKIREYLDQNIPKPGLLERVEKYTKTHPQFFGDWVGESLRTLREANLARAAAPETWGASMGASALNSALLGIPEAAARTMGLGAFFDEMRRQSPYASTAGDITGLVVPGSLAARGAKHGLSALASRSRGSVDDTMSALKTGQINPVIQAAGRVGKRAAELGSGVVGAQIGYSALGGAGAPQNPLAGAVANATNFQREAQKLPGIELVPGLQPTIGTLTAVVPSVLGYGGMMATDPVKPVAPMSPDAQRRQSLLDEAWRRALAPPAGSRP